MSERETFISNLMREDIARIMYAFKPLLVGDNVPEPVVDKWIAVSAIKRRPACCESLKFKSVVEFCERAPRAPHLWAYKMAIHSSHSEYKTMARENGATGTS